MRLKNAALVSAWLLWGAAAPAAPRSGLRADEHCPGPPSQAAAASWLFGLDDGALAGRVLDVSARFLGTPYVHSPLGEGAGVDPDAIIRFDAVDCLTFVEETLALSIARSPTQVVPILLHLRYGRGPLYEDRN